MANSRLRVIAALILTSLLGGASWSNAQDGRRGRAPDGTKVEISHHRAPPHTP